MTTIADKDYAAEAAVCQRHVDSLVATHTGIRGAVIATTDGFEIAAHVDSSVSVAKLAAMVSSLSALSEAVSRESKIGSSRDLMIDAESGRLLLVDASTGARKRVLAVLCDTRETLGQALWAVRSCREAILRELEGH